MTSRTAVLGLVCVAATACKSEQTLTVSPVDSVAVTTGDFDYIAAPLDRLVVDHESYEGLISVATWSDDYDPALQSLKVEGLLGSTDELLLHDVAMVASGTRGFGAQVYNGLDPDDQLVNDPAVIANLVEYVDRGGVLVVTDWAYDLVDVAWPGTLTFIGDGAVDAAQHGLNGTVTATVSDPVLVTELGGDTAAIEFDFSNWAVISEVSRDVVVHLEADVEYLGEATEGNVPLPAAPLLVSFVPPGARGKVVFSTFHFDAQLEQLMDTIMLNVVADFEPAESTTLSVEG
jgi:hypothetical protein